MTNVKMKVDGKILLITVDLSVDGLPSKTGKSVIVASTQGNVEVPGKGGMKLGLNLYKPIRT